VTDVCNSSYSEGSDQEDRGSKPAWAKSFMRPCLKKEEPPHKKALVSGSSSNPSTTKKKKKKKERKKEKKKRHCIA
jgi:hypothetical protein